MTAIELRAEPGGRSATCPATATVEHLRHPPRLPQLEHQAILA